jgi:phospholipid/cholesterol/gamma-HCH transport system substrate-binding protein
MASKNIELKVGLLVLAGAAIVILAIWLAKGYQYGREFYTVSALFPEVGALASGDPVAVSGVNMGKVKRLVLHEGQVLVTLELSTEVVLKEDASFIVKNIGLMGERFVAVRTGASPTPLDLSRPAAGSVDAGIPEVMGMMGEAIDNMNELVQLLKETVISPATLDKFSATITDLHDISGRLNAATRTNVPKLDTAIQNFAQLSQDLTDVLDRNRDAVDTAVGNFDLASRRLLQMLSQMEEASAKLRTFADDLEASEGTLRLLMEDRRLYDDIRTTAKNLDSLIQDIRSDPKKYINFTVEIF